MNLHDTAELTQFLSAQSFYPCLLLVSTQIDTLDHALADLATHHPFPRIDVAQLIAPVLIPLPITAYGATAVSTLRTAVQNQTASTLLLSQIDILFEPALQLDPLTLIKTIARQSGTRLIVAWPGSVAGGKLAYATPDHGRYRIWQRPEINFMIQL